MSADKNRRFYDVAIEPAAAEFLQATSQSIYAKGSERASLQDEPTTLPSYFALGFNFKPDSTHDCKKGALFQPGPSRNPAADWRLELDDDKPASTSDNGASKKPAHVFTGPQTAAKSYDVVLVWDHATQTYRLDRVAATFSLKYERSKTTLSTQSQEVWEKDAEKPRRRPAGDSSAAPLAASGQEYDRRDRSSLRREQATLAQPYPVTGKASLSSSSSSSEGLRLRSRKAPVATPLRRSSRGGLPVEMEEFDDQPTTVSAQAPQTEPSGRGDSKNPRNSAHEEHRTPTPESTGGLRRSRRHSTQVQADESKSLPLGRTEKLEPERKTEIQHVDENTEGDDDELALELERELERELDMDMDDASDNERPASPPQGRTTAPGKPMTSRALSPVSRRKLSDRQSKISTPKAHTPEAEDIDLPTERIPAISSPSTSRSTLANDAPIHSKMTASIGLGLQQTGVRITPTASPHLGTASAKTVAVQVEPSEGESQVEDASLKVDGRAFEEGRDDDDDDDLDDFAAELDMSLAEVPDPVPAMEIRRSARGLSSVQSTADSMSSSRPQRQVRKAYGLGGPRQEEEDLEDSD